ncbi:MAG: MFS transporter [Alphaproteobacteria bacterium]
MEVPQEETDEPARSPAPDEDTASSRGGGDATLPGRPVRPAAKWVAITLLSVAGVLALSLWFSATTVVPALRQEFGIGDVQASLLTSSVSVGFVVGTLISAVLGLADRLDARRFFSVSTFVAAAANAAVLLADPTTLSVPLLRFIVGVSMAGIYPVGMKLASTWARADTGLLVGLLVGALTLGSASPHLINALGRFDWRLTLAAASVLAVVSGVLVLFVKPGPALQRATRFEARYVLVAWTRRSLRLANLGYFGHMWELYAMWTWAGLFLSASFVLNPGGDRALFYAKLVTFAAVGIGALGCILGGLFADRLGRTTLTMGAMAVSGTCAVLAGLFFGSHPWLVTALFLVWGVTVVADSAQFSASIIELSEPWMVGTMVTVQTSVGFLLTIVTIHLIPPLVDLVGWSFAFSFLAIGPFLGVWAMGTLRRLPEAARLAGGNR